MEHFLDFLLEMLLEPILHSTIKDLIYLFRMLYSWTEEAPIILDQAKAQIKPNYY